MTSYRKDFPILQQKFKGKRLVYLDSAATSQKPHVVIDAVREFYETYNSNIHRGLYGIAEKATEGVENVRKKLANLINAKNTSEIVFTHGTTEGINILANGISIQNTSEIILTEMEHHSNLIPWQEVVKKKKAHLSYMRISEDGGLGLPIKRDSKYRRSIISLTHVSNVLGTINDIKSLSQEAHVVIVDAAQSVPHMPVDVQDLDCSFLAFSGHKMLAPTGVGILYGKEHLLKTLDPFVYGSQMIDEVSLEKTTFRKSPEKFEPGTLPIEGIIGLGAAIDYMEDIGMKRIREHEKALTRFALEQLRKVEGLTVYGPENEEARSGVISFTMKGVHPHDTAQVLGDMNICIRAGHHCAMPLHKRLGVSATARISFHIYNDEEDIEALMDGLREVKKLFSLR